jgi:predicted metal-binding membrane protein
MGRLPRRTSPSELVAPIGAQGQMTEAAITVPRADRPLASLAATRRRVVIPTVAVLVGLAGVGWYLSVQYAGGMSSMVSGLGQVGTRAPFAMSAPLFMLMWLAMMGAMMFPTIAPIVLAHELVVRKRGEGALPTLSFVLGYIAIWTIIGLIPLALFGAFDGVAARLPAPVWIPYAAGATLIGAGLYQFTPFKGRCVTACRTPFDFIVTHDFGRGSKSAFRAGTSHGAYCVGCCWALMSVLVVVGVMNLVWMAAIAIVFLAEKNLRHGVLISRLAGLAVAGLGITILLVPGLLVTVSGGAAPAIQISM